MAVYYVLMHTITDPERYRREYIPGTGPLLGRYGGEMVAVTLEAEAVQGDPPGAVAIVRFPSDEAARAFVNDPDYLPLKGIRLETTSGSSAVLVPEFAVPGG